MAAPGRLFFWRAALLAISGGVFWLVFETARASETYPKRAGGIAFMAAIVTATLLAMVARHVRARRARDAGSGS